MVKTLVPTFYETAFNCPRCGVLAPQNWYDINRMHRNQPKAEIIERDPLTQPMPTRAIVNAFGNVQHPHVAWHLYISICHHCQEYAVWENRRMIYPFKTDLPQPHEDMPEDVKGIYNEATNVYKHSPRASAALLRLAIETMIPQLEEYNIKKDNLNTMIGELVKKDIPEHIQKGLDVIRVYGNEGIHPGEIMLNDEQGTVEYLFELLNYMTEELITKKKKLNSFYDKLPLKKLEGILRRDKAKAKE